MFYNTTTSAWENAHPVKDDEVTTAKILNNAVTDAKLASGANGIGTRTISTSAASGGSDGDIWYKVAT